MNNRVSLLHNRHNSVERNFQKNLIINNGKEFNIIKRASNCEQDRVIIRHSSEPMIYEMSYLSVFQEYSHPRSYSSVLLAPRPVKALFIKSVIYFPL